MPAAINEPGWAEAATQIRAELAALRARLGADWAVVLAPMPLPPRAPFAHVLLEDRDPGCQSALGIALPLVGNAWADELFARGGAATVDARHDPRLAMFARLFERNDVSTVVSGGCRRDGETLCAVDVYARRALTLPPDPVGVVAATAERIAHIVERSRRAQPAEPDRAPPGSELPRSAVDPITASALHDLKNALAAQSLLISSMEKELRAAAAGEGPGLGGAVLESLAVLRDSVEHASDLTRVMTLATLAPGGRTAIDVPGLARLALAALPSDLRERFRVEADPALVGAGVVREAPALLRALVNLLQNAALAIQRDSSARATVRTRLDGNDVLVEVDDEGPGISPDVIDRLFEPGVTTRDRADGHGYGLHAARATVESFGGHLALYSVPGGGAQFIIRVPRRAAGLD